MPRIHRIRVTNIQYDYGKKQMPDLLFDTGSLDTLLLLANGGGKSLFIQLLLQTVLPREKMNGRSIADLLQSERYTGHIAVEWLLDRPGDHKQFLCTGFCFTNGRNQNPLESFNYLFEYDERAEWHIGSLPLIQEHPDGGRRPIGYQQLRDWLKAEVGSRLELPESIADYQRRLRSRNILHEEWKNIRDTNGSEGGVDKFFEKSKTTAQLMDHLLIPSVEEMIFQSEAKKKELIHAFAEYRTMLLNIPMIKQNLKDFGLIRHHAEEVVAQVQRYDQQLRQWEKKKTEWLRLAKTFRQFEQQAVMELQAISEKQDQVEAVLKETEWKVESHEVFLKQLSLDKAVKEEEEAKQEFERESQSLAQLKKQEQEAGAFFHYGRAQQFLQEAAGIRSRIEAMELSEPELQAALKHAKRQLRAAWEKSWQDMLQQEEKKQAELAGLQAQLQQVKDRKATLQEERSRYVEQRAKLEHGLADYERKKQEVASKVSAAYSWSPAEGVEAYRQEVREREQEEGNLGRQLANLEGQLVQLEERLQEISEQKQQLRQERVLVADQVNRWRKEEAEIQGLLAAQSIYSSALIEDKDKILLDVRARVQESSEARSLLQAEVASLEEKWALIEDQDYYIPQQELVKVKQKLERSGIHLVLGSEWLASQALSPEDKAAYLKHQPLLPFSILIEAHQVNQVKHIMRQGKEGSADSPILFLVKSGESLRAADSPDSFLPLVQDELFIYQPEAFELYTSQDAFQKYKNQMQTTMGEKRQTLQGLKEAEGQWLNLRHQVEHFYKTYSHGIVKGWTEQLARLDDQLKTLEQAGEDERKRKTALTAEQKEQQVRLKQNAEQLLLAQSRLELLESFIPLHAEYPKQVKLKNEVEEALQQVDRAQQECEKETDRLWEGIEVCKAGIREQERRMAQHQTEYSHYQLGEAEAGTAEETYHTLKVQVDSLIEQWNQKDRDRQLLEDQRRRAEQAAAEALDDCKQTGLDLEWIGSHYRIVEKEEWRKINRAVQQQQLELETVRTIFHSAQTRKETAMALWNERKNQLEGKFSLLPYDEYRELTHEDQLRFFQEQAKSMQMERNVLKQRFSNTEDWKREVEAAREHSEERLQAKVEQWGEDVGVLTPAEWMAYDAKPMKIVRQLDKEREALEKRVQDQKHEVDKHFQKYLRQLEETKNPRVKQFIRDVQVILDDQRLYDYDFVETQFLRIFEGLDLYQEEYQRTLEESETSQRQLTQLCLRRARTILESVMEIPKNSRVVLYGKEIQLIKIDWRTRDDEEGFGKMNQYLQKVLEDLQRCKQEGMDDDRLDSRMEDLLRTRNLIEVIAPMEECRVLVYKPRKESLVRHQKVEYSPWEEVSRWSGGEEYSIYITMFMIMISHIRQQTEGRRNIWKVLVADNPFGKASSAHILETVFQVARANRIQLICLTAHKQEGILERFPVVYSLQLRSAFGKEIMKAEQLETGFYRLEVSGSQDDHQMSLGI
ncbi:hypothetical protein [Ammoniphilus sp. CFH 90114]|uniref:hypothetical protein n=1 Tax=Ammoniphilus sp. CFH 90114 TaxID=2493665 RepID=UPI001027A954|nr:hypothetical protein [Ammoniphilus sp. CFH 90114]RXT07774.1 hypothetical protein EIZ39_10090 [Ammoniphilus sp. CFH 90114]